jgi:branched-chain amino acid transport system permease protein
MSASSCSSEESVRSSIMPRWLLVLGCGLLAAAILAGPPLLTERVFFLHLGVLIFLNTIIVLGLFLVSRTGQLSLCHAAFVGLGAYCSTLLVINFKIPALLGVVLAGVLAGLVALVIGSITLRLRGVYFVLVTFLCGQVFNLLLLDAPQLTRGANGIVGIPSIYLFGLPISGAARFYPFAGVVAVLVLLAVIALLRGAAGRALASVEENITLAESTGIDTQRYQRLSFALGSAIAGIGGALFAHYIRFISPDSFTFWDSVTYIVMLVVGGRGSVFGAVIGVALMTPMPELLRSMETFQHFAYGAILIVILKLLPNGIVALFPARRDRTLPQ